jgi:adenylosuccinate synthase
VEEVSLTVVVGGQYGSEGKGKLVAYLARAAEREVAVVRCGGPNSGHTVEFRGRPYPLRQLPSAAVVEGTWLFLGAGMVIDPKLLQKELTDLNIDKARVRIDRNAVVLDRADLRRERRSKLRTRIGSTLSGTGSATARKVLRDPRQQTLKDLAAFHDLVTDVSSRLNALIDGGRDVVVEGTQGIGLSLHHSQSFPYATSRDTSAAAFLSEVGLSPMLVSDVITVFRSFPIRVAGNSGPLPGEISWEELTRRAGAPRPVTETTTVTKRTRRVAEFDWDQATEAVKINRPTRLALHGLDYINYEDRCVRSLEKLSKASRYFIDAVESRLGVPVAFGFTGPGNDDIVDLRNDLATGNTRRREAVGAHG